MTTYKIEKLHHHNMKKIWTRTLLIISLLPTFWTIAILIAAYFYIWSHGLVDFFLWTAVIYFIFGGLISWIATLIILTLLKKLSIQQTLCYLLITACGILLAYLSLAFNIFGVAGNYID